MRPSELATVRHPVCLALAASLLGALWLVGLAIRLWLLVLHGGEPYLAGMAQGDLAYSIVSGQGLLHEALPGCGIGVASNSLGRLVDVEEYLSHYRSWCASFDEGVTRRHLGIVEPEPFIAYMMPGPGILLAGTYYLTGQLRYIQLQVLQALLDSFGVVLLFALGRRHFGPAVGALAAAAYAAFLPAARLAVAGGIRDAWMPILQLATLYCFLRAAAASERQRTGWLVACGASIAVTCYFRPSNLFLPVFLVGLMVATRRIPLRSAPAAGAALVIPVVVILAPWWIRNYLVFGRLLLTNAGMSVSLWQWLGEYDNPFGIALSDTFAYDYYRANGGTASYFSLDFAEDYFGPLFRQVVLQHPGWYAALLVRRVVSLPFQQLDWTIDPMSVPLMVRRLLYKAFTPALFASAPLALWMFRSTKVALVLSVFLYTVLSHVPVGTLNRYMLPSYPALFLTSAAVAWLLCRRAIDAFILVAGGMRAKALGRPGTAGGISR